MRDAQGTTAVAAGAFLTLFGLAGFFTGQTIMGFGANSLANFVHLVSGLVGILAFTQDGSSGFNRAAGVFYLAIALIGLVASGFTANLLAANTATHILHLVVGAALALAGFTARAATGRGAVT